MGERRWRCVSGLDPCWQYEESDPSFLPRHEGSTEVEGWRPVGFVWKAYLGLTDKVPERDFTGYVPRVSSTPWHGRIFKEGPKGPCRSYGSLEEAETDTEQRVDQP